MKKIMCLALAALLAIGSIGCQTQVPPAAIEKAASSADNAMVAQKELEPLMVTPTPSPMGTSQAASATSAPLPTTETATPTSTSPTATQAADLNAIKTPDSIIDALEAALNQNLEQSLGDQMMGKIIGQPSEGTLLGIDRNYYAPPVVDENQITVITNVNIVPVTQSEVLMGDIIIKGSKIEKIGIDLEVPANARVIEGTGLTAYPGLIDAHSHLGMSSDSTSNYISSVNEATSPITAELRAIDEYDPMSLDVLEAAKSGVTTVCVGPGSANVVGGQFAAVKTLGRTVEDVLVKAPVALKAAFGENPMSVYGSKDLQPSTRMGIAAVLRQFLTDGKTYIAENKSGDLAMDAIAGVIKGEYPLKVHAHKANDIMTALRIAKEFNIKITLDHCTEGYMILDKIAQSGASVIIGPYVIDRSKQEVANMSAASCVDYEKAGIAFAIVTDAPVVPQYTLQTAAAFAIKEGLTEKTALEAITINPARILGIDNRVGSLEEGKDADIVLIKGDLFDVRNSPEYVFINGAMIKN